MKRPWKLVVFCLAVSVMTVLLASLLRPAPAVAANPTTMSFQGKVVNANGTNVTDGTYAFVFKLYTVSSGGSAIWTETQAGVTVTAGVFQVNLGSSCPFFVANACNSSTPIDFNANPNLHLGITFNSDPAGEMSPRVQLQSVPFAFNSDRVGGRTVSELVHLSPGSQQSGFINISGALQATSIDINSSVFTVSNTGVVTASGTINGLTLSGTSIAGNGTGTLVVTPGGTARNLTLDGTTTGLVQIGGTSTGDIELGGGTAGSSGCTLTNASGNFACNGTLNGATISGGSLSATDVNGLNVSSTAITATGALSIAAGGTAQNLTLDASTSGVIRIGNTSTGDVELAGGSGGNGCTVANSSGNLTCAGILTINGTGTSSIAGSLGLGTTPSYQLDLRGVSTSQLHLGSDGTDSGAYLTGLNSGSAILSSNIAYNGTTYVAKATGASQLAQFGGTLFFQSDTGLTVGGTYTPTIRFAVDPFGNIAATGNITGLTINGVVGINTGASAGTQRIDASGNLVNIGTITAVGTASINATGTASTTIGNGTGTFTLNSSALDVSAGGALSGVTDLTASGRIYLASTTGTNGQGYFLRNTTPTPVAAFQAAETGSNSYGFFAVNKYFNGSAWVDSGLNRVGSSFQIQDDNFNFYSFDTAANFTSRFVLASGGNVGIGNNVVPGYKLDVQGGDINVSANLRTGGTQRIDSSGNLLNIGTITSVGTASINATGTAATTIGNASGAFTLSSTGLNVTSAGALSGITTLSLTGALTGTTALAIAAGGTAQNLTLNGATTGLVQIGATSTGNIELGGGPGSTGCTLTNSTGLLACTGDVNAVAGFQFNGTDGDTLAACAANAYIGNAVKLDGGIITAGTCRTDATGISDIRLKENVSQVRSALDTISQHELSAIT